MIKKKSIFLIFLIIFLINNISAENFTIVVLPDTQKYSEFHPEIFMNQTKWIVQNKDILNIRAVIQLGDLVRNNKIEEWEVANKSMSILNGKVPYLTLPGNHDIENNNLINYKKYFGEVNNFMLLEDLEIGILTLGDKPQIEDLNWANGVVSTYKEYDFIIGTHRYIGYGDTKVLKRNEFIWKYLLEKNKNIFLITSASNENPEEFSISYRDDGSSVCEILSNYERVLGGKSGYLRYYTFSGEKVEAKTYSPYINNHSTNFVLRYNSSGCSIYSEKPRLNLFSWLFNWFYKTYDSFQLKTNNYACINEEIIKIRNPEGGEIPSAEEKCLQDCMLYHNIGFDKKYKVKVGCKESLPKCIVRSDKRYTLIKEECIASPICNCKVGLG